ncbi:unnamed protein product, partial [Adineta ricciae]
MRGWFKLIETIRQTDPPSNVSTIPTTITTSTNGHGSPHSSDAMQFVDDLPTESPPTEALEDIPMNTTQKSTDSKRSSSRHKRITIRKSVRSKEFPSVNSASTEDILPPRKRQSIDSSLNISIVPIATDLQSLPGHAEDELRDQRYRDYADVKTLSVHLNSCLHIDRRFASSNKQQFFKSRHNILNKIFKMNYFKSSPDTFDMKKEEPDKTDIPSVSSSFKLDWSVNRRSSSSHRHEPRNLFHILQSNPKKHILKRSKHEYKKELSAEEEIQLHYEHIQKLLVRTYYPHFHIAVERGHTFGSKSKLFAKQSHLPIVIDPSSPADVDDSMTIKLNSPVSTSEHDSGKRRQRSKQKHNKERPQPIALTERRVSEEIPAVVILQSPPPPREVNNNTIDSQKRKISVTVHSAVPERKRKKLIILPLSPELASNESQDLSCSDSDDDILPDELPKQNIIKNGLRSNFYKTANELDSKSANTKNRSTRRQPISSGSLPPFYTAIFQSDENKLSYIDYKLPYDIYWHSQKRTNATITSPLKAVAQPKKKSSESKQKQELPNKRPIPPLIQHNFPSPTKKHLHKVSVKIEELTEEEKRIVSQSSIFLKRNFRRIKEQKESKDKNNSQHKQQAEELSVPLLFSQNYYHPYLPQQLSHPKSISHRDFLYLFANHIRRSHFGKTGQYYLELVNQTCYYAQLAQLTLVLKDMFELLLNYKCHNGDVYPSNALKKCPLKRLFPMYYEIISKPIDLSIIHSKLDNGEYLTYASFEQ